MEISQDVAPAKPMSMSMPRMIALAMAFFTTAVITTSVAVLFAGDARVVGTALTGI
jgi:hypothetical protein